MATFDGSVAALLMDYCVWTVFIWELYYICILFVFFCLVSFSLATSLHGGKVRSFLV